MPKPETPKKNEEVDEDTTPRDTLPALDQQLGEIKPKPGWQTSPLPEKEWKPRCRHIGRIGAAMQSSQYPLGAEWVCTCGQIFVLALNAGDKRTLLLKEDVVEEELTEKLKEASFYDA